MDDSIDSNISDNRVLVEALQDTLPNFSSWNETSIGDEIDEFEPTLSDGPSDNFNFATKELPVITSGDNMEGYVDEDNGSLFKQTDNDVFVANLAKGLASDMARDDDDICNDISNDFGQLDDFKISPSAVTEELADLEVDVDINSSTLPVSESYLSKNTNSTKISSSELSDLEEGEVTVSMQGQTSTRILPTRSELPKTPAVQAKNKTQHTVCTRSSAKSVAKSIGSNVGPEESVAMSGASNIEPGEIQQPGKQKPKTIGAVPSLSNKLVDSAVTVDLKRLDISDPSVFIMGGTKASSDGGLHICTKCNVNFDTLSRKERHVCRRSIYACVYCGTTYWQSLDLEKHFEQCEAKLRGFRPKFCFWCTDASPADDKLAKSAAPKPSDSAQAVSFLLKRYNLDSNNAKPRTFAEVYNKINKSGDLDPQTSISKTSDPVADTTTSKDRLDHQQVADHRYQCVQCGRKTFKSINDLHRHCKSHLFQGFYSCWRCEAEFTDHANLEIHELDHYRRGDWRVNFPCQIINCNTVFDFFVDWFDHLSQHIQFSGLISCSKCPLIFPSKKIMEEHIASAHPKPLPRFKCNLCGVMFTTVRSLAEHVSGSHDLVSADNVTGSSATSWPTRCALCRISFPTADACSQHMLLQHYIPLGRKAERRCPCGVYCYTLAELQKCSHAPGARDVCAKCGGRSYTGADIKFHQVIYHGANPRAAFTNARTKPATAVRHKAKRPSAGFRPIQRVFSCSVCNNKFSNEVIYRRHLLSHNNTNMQFACKYCSQGFKTRRSVITHTYSHTGEKPYRCKVCGIRCTQQTALRGHLEQHQRGHGPMFTCDICLAPFNRVSYRDFHRKLHLEGGVVGLAGVDEGRLFYCRVCRIPYARRAICEQHERVHYELGEGEATGEMRTKRVRYEPRTGKLRSWHAVVEVSSDSDYSGDSADWRAQKIAYLSDNSESLGEENSRGDFKLSDTDEDGNDEMADSEKWTDRMKKLLRNGRSASQVEQPVEPPNNVDAAGEFDTPSIDLSNIGPDDISTSDLEELDSDTDDLRNIADVSKKRKADYLEEDSSDIGEQFDTGYLKRGIDDDDDDEDIGMESPVVVGSPLPADSLGEIGGLGGLIGEVPSGSAMHDLDIDMDLI